MKAVTVVVGLEDDADVKDFWTKIKTAGNLSVLHAKMDDAIYRGEVLEKYILGLLALASPDAKVFVDPLGEHWWKFVGGVFANDQSLIKASKVYKTQQELEAIEGKLSLKS